MHDVWEFVKSSSQKLLGNNSKMMGLVLLQSHFPLGLVAKECFFKSGINRQRLAFNFDLLPYTTWWRFSSALTKDQINVLFKLQFGPIEMPKVIPHFCIQHNARITRIYSSYKSPLDDNFIKCKNISASDWLLGQRQSAWRQLVLCNLETFFIHENESYGKKPFKLILKLINFNGPLLACMIL